MPGFYDCVLETWNKQVPSNQNPLRVLHIKMGRTTKALRTWSKALVPKAKLALAVCREVIAQLDVA
jgi:hypothetical protein